MIRVRIFQRTGRKFFEAQWTDPVTGRLKTRSTKETKRREAERFAARLEADLEKGKTDVRKMAWADFRERYAAEVLAHARPKTRFKMQGTLNLVEKHVNPRLLVSLTPQVISQFGSTLRTGRAPLTVRGHLANVRNFLRWAHRMKMIPEVPAIDIPTVEADAGGRAVTGEEFDRMLAVVADVVGEEQAASWDFLLRGFWWGGLRLAECIDLQWNAGPFRVDRSGKRPMFRIAANTDKSGKARLLPMTPEFAALLDEAEHQHGYVFNPKPLRCQQPVRLGADWIGRVIGDIGERAGVMVAEKRGRKKHATAHDLRRAFGFRWAQRVMPPTLMELMRHDDISTTMQFYVGHQAQQTAEVVWRTVTDTSANSAVPATPSAESAVP